MIQDHQDSTSDVVSKQNWISCSSPEKLEKIHQYAVNIAIYNRDIRDLSKEINQLLDGGIEISVSGIAKEIVAYCTEMLVRAGCPMLLKDIEELLLIFEKVSRAKDLKFLLAVRNTDLCRKFHTDMNDLRMLCTYRGPGTLWLAEDNIDREALNRSIDDNKDIALDKQRIQQISTGDVAILKGALYQKKGTKAAVHRSPEIEESGERRLLLRIDTNEFLNF